MNRGRVSSRPPLEVIKLSENWRNIGLVELNLEIQSVDMVCRDARSVEMPSAIALDLEFQSPFDHAEPHLIRLEPVKTG